MLGYVIYISTAETIIEQLIKLMKNKHSIYSKSARIYLNFSFIQTSSAALICKLTSKASVESIMKEF